MADVSRLEELPRFPAPQQPPELDAWELRISGLVTNPGVVTFGAIQAMQRIDLVGDFRCEEGWEVPGLRWSGVPVARLLADAQPHPSARYVGIAAGGFATWFALEHIGEAEPLLASHLDGEPLPWEHGGPLRLVLTGGICYQSVKWVDRLVLASEPGAETAEHIAMDRLQS